MIESKAKITISRTQDNKRQEDRIHISVKDEPSSNLVCDLYMSLKDFAACLTGLGYQDAELIYYENDVVGKKLEIKQEIIRFPVLAHRPKVELLYPYVKHYESEGYKVDMCMLASDFNNPHKYHFTKDGSKEVSIVFKRYV